MVTVQEEDQGGLEYIGSNIERLINSYGHGIGNRPRGTWV